LALSTRPYLAWLWGVAGCSAAQAKEIVMTIDTRIEPAMTRRGFNFVSLLLSIMSVAATFGG
jgi:hypothetical protein